jgi:hypothetical protein
MQTWSMRCSRRRSIKCARFSSFVRFAPMPLTITMTRARSSISISGRLSSVQLETGSSPTSLAVCYVSERGFDMTGCLARSSSPLRSTTQSDRSKSFLETGE